MKLSSHVNLSIFSIRSVGNGDQRKHPLLVTTN